MSLLTLRLNLTVMKTFFTILALLMISTSNLFGQTDTLIVEAACGQCQFDMTQKKGCDLAVRIDGTAYFVDGSTIDEHGDAHAEDGACNTIRKAKVTGHIINNRFYAESFEMLKSESIKH